MADTPVSSNFLIPTSPNIDVSNTPVSDNLETTSSAISVDGTAVIPTIDVVVTSSSIEVSATIINDLKESVLSYSTVDASAPIQSPTTDSSIAGTVEVSANSFSSTATASEQLTKVQIWTIS